MEPVGDKITGVFARWFWSGMNARLRDPAFKLVPNNLTPQLPRLAKGGIVSKQSLQELFAEQILGKPVLKDGEQVGTVTGVDPEKNTFTAVIDHDVFKSIDQGIDHSVCFNNNRAWGDDREGEGVLDNFREDVEAALKHLQTLGNPTEFTGYVTQDVYTALKNAASPGTIKYGPPAPPPKGRLWVLNPRYWLKWLRYKNEMRRWKRVLRRVERGLGLARRVNEQVDRAVWQGSSVDDWRRMHPVDKAVDEWRTWNPGADSVFENKEDDT